MEDPTLPDAPGPRPPGSKKGALWLLLGLLAALVVAVWRWWRGLPD